MRKRFRILKQILKRKTFQDGQSIMVLGKTFTLRFLKSPTSRNSVVTDSQSLLVYAVRGKTHNEVLLKWLREIARKYATKKLNKLSKDYGFKFNRIAIKDTTSRWGSCSSKKNLNFSWRLVTAPVEIFDYVIVHEFCHLKEMNHSINFWNFVKSIDPNYNRSRRWLREHGGGLF